MTGTFDNWSKSVKLEKHGNDTFYKTVSLPSEKVYYKFVVDGNWVTDHTKAQESDYSGNVNNVLTVQDLKAAPASSSFLSSASPSSSSAEMAGKQPFESSRDVQDKESPQFTKDDLHEHDIPGAFPETPFGELGGFNLPSSSGSDNNAQSTSRDESSLASVAEEDTEQSFGVSPIPASSGRGNPINLAPGEPVPHPSTFNDNTVQSTVRDDPSLISGEEDDEQTFGVAPIPATSGIGNPIKLAAGEAVPDPSTLTRNTVDSTVGDMRYNGGAPILPPVLDESEEREAAGASMFGIPSLGSLGGSSRSMIPESSLPMYGNADLPKGAGFGISSAAPQSTSAQLAGQQPIRERGVPEVVQDSQEAADAEPEASSNAEAVREKSAVEDELRSTVAEVPGNSATTGTGNAESVPAVVTQSQHKARADPEAAASPAAVDSKSAMEEELRQKVPEESSASESGTFGKSEKGIFGALAGGLALAGGAIAAQAYTAKDKATEALNSSNAGQSSTGSMFGGLIGSKGTETSDSSSLGQSSTGSTLGGLKDKATEAYNSSSLGQSSTGASLGGLTGMSGNNDTSTRDDVPDVVTESPQMAHVDPEASASTTAVHNKSAMEEELMHKVPEEAPISESGFANTSSRDIPDSDSDYDDNSIVPEVVTESQQIAHVDPEASASTTAVHNKSAMEEELMQKVSEEPSISASGMNTTAATRDVPSSMTESEQTPDVPEVVIESQHIADVDPEASASTSAVHHKSALEDELKQTVPEEPATSESGVFGKSEKGILGGILGGAAVAGGALAAGAYAARDKVTETYDQATTGLSSTGPSTSEPSATGPSTSIPSITSTDRGLTETDEVPAVVTESQQIAHVDPEAAASPSAVHDKSAMEAELKRTVSEEPATAESGTFGKSEKGLLAGLAGGAAVAGGAFAAKAYAARDKATDTYNQSVAPAVGTSQIGSSNTVGSSQIGSSSTAGTSRIGSPSTGEREQTTKKSEKGILGGLTGGAAVAGGAIATGAYAARDKATDTYNQTVAPAIGTSQIGSSSTGERELTTEKSAVPAVVTESQREAHVAPEAAASPEVVREKSAVEKELLAEVRKEPSISESGVFGKSKDGSLGSGIFGKSEGGISGKVAAGAAAAGAAVAGGAYAARDKAAETTGYLPKATESTGYLPKMAESTGSSFMATESADYYTQATQSLASPLQAAESTESRSLAFLPPSVASAITTMNHKTEYATGLGETSVSPVSSPVLPAATLSSFTPMFNSPDDTAAKSSSFSPIPSQFDEPAATSPSFSPVSSRSAVPEIVTESQQAARFAPEASAVPDVVAEKSAVEQELLKSVKPSNEFGELAPSDSAALATTAPKATEASSPAFAGGAFSSPSAPPTGAAAAASSSTPATGAGLFAAPALGSTAASSTPAASSTTASSLNAGDNQAQTGGLRTPVHDSRDVSPMSRPATNQTQTTERLAPIASAASNSPVTPQKSKRSSMFHGTPDSSRTNASHTSEASTATEGKPKKRSFLSKLKEKFKS